MCVCVCVVCVCGVCVGVCVCVLSIIQTVKTFLSLHVGHQKRQEASGVYCLLFSVE